MSDDQHLGRRLVTDVLEPLKRTFVGKDEIVDLLGVCLIARENLFILGPPGTAKSALVQELGRRLDGRVFDYLLTRFTEPNELFGPFDIRRLREGELITNTEGMLPEADFVFLDELLNANSAILNSLLLALNERLFRRGRETRRLPMLMAVGASNRLPEDDALAALFDRFLLRVHCDNVAREEMADVLAAGWKLDVEGRERATTVTVEEIRRLADSIRHVDLLPTRSRYVELVHRLRHAGISISDRRAVKLQRLMAASALLCDRRAVDLSDMWVLRYIWETEEQRDVLDSIVQDAIGKPAADAADVTRHPRSRGGDAPDPERLARDLERIAEKVAAPDLAATERAYLRDQLGLMSGRCEWIIEDQPRRFLESRIQELWPKLGGPTE